MSNAIVFPKLFVTEGRYCIADLMRECLSSQRKRFARLFDHCHVAKHDGQLTPVFSCHPIQARFWDDDADFRSSHPIAVKWSAEGAGLEYSVRPNGGREVCLLFVT
jgi:hypothetical protein